MHQMLLTNFVHQESKPIISPISNSLDKFVQLLQNQDSQGDDINNSPLLVRMSGYVLALLVSMYQIISILMKPSFYYNIRFNELVPNNEHMTCTEMKLTFVGCLVGNFVGCPVGDFVCIHNTKQIILLEMHKLKV